MNTSLLVLLFLFGLVSHGLANTEPPLVSTCSGPVGGDPGQCAPALPLNRLSGDAFEGSIPGGEAIVIHFWATWCEPCKDELPALIAMKKALESEGIRIITVSLDLDVKALKQFATQFPELDVLIDSTGKVSERYGTFKVPETYIVDPNGTIKDKVVGSWYWDNSVTRNYLVLLANQKP